MEFLKNEIKSSNIILLATPVYLRQESGLMKNFLGRIAQWTYTLELRGKIGSIITLSSSNEKIETSQYMQYIIQQLGAVDLG
ncbi:hypothetical protein FC89_GL002294 [Liquorilactobacillus ghanensis DSM 18630]|jgi:multimeric flavodoxin WrbA|uniref:NADPH-dependent FMN reductase-like domain-containing protein n=1 Tax=Liquorilactobacillus ghanensis DSM 18630 TaxID=1423750 RepID=A0A0R1VLD9_9LACO|nr:NAD(P)H-dependent oxidoreductase [Liquorilactobacillus ghanensis]KRM04603.1 hypothetical protein FC89_GL002294 [Liquorilactobacillus ghanensis DSM 18630]